jgi:PilZ domain
MNDPVGPLSDESPASAKRGMDRDSLFLKAILRFGSSKNETEVRIRNLSAGGLMAEAPLRVTRGESVEINLRSIGWITGHVAWVTEGRVGIAFDHPINPMDARKPVGTAAPDIPPYLKKLNNPAAPNKLRRL